jgi:leader peptidase (prepilin peptidase)/N-methyltransferase
VVYSLFVSSLLIISFIDLDHRIIPDEISLTGIIVGVAASFLLKGVSPLSSLAGVFLGGGILFLVAFGYEKVAHKEGMGGGDIKLIAMIGAFIGWKGIPFVILVSSLIGAIIGITFMIIEKKDTKFAIPFGPFLSLGAVIYLFVGPELITWYLALGRGGG